MSTDQMERYRRDDIRRTVLLNAHLEAGRWKSEVWALADSLSWALSTISASAPAGTEVDDTDAAEWMLARTRLERVRRELAGGSTSKEES